MQAETEKSTAATYILPTLILALAAAWLNDEAKT